MPIEALGAFEPADDRRDPVAILEQQEKERLQFLVPVRHASVLQNAFGFYRGAPAVMPPTSAPACAPTSRCSCAATPTS